MNVIRGTERRQDVGFDGTNGGKFDATVTEHVLPKSVASRATKDPTNKV